MSDVEAARAAKAELRKQMKRNPRVVGLGLGIAGDDYFVKVNLSEPDNTVPARVGSVEVVTEVVGVVRARRAPARSTASQRSTAVPGRSGP